MESSGRKIHLKHLKGQPLFRISVFRGQEYVDFKVMGKFNVEDGEGNEIIRKVKSSLKWRVKIKESKPGKSRYFLVLYESFDKARVEQKLKLAQHIDEKAKIQVVGGDIFLDNRKINNNTKYMLTAGNFPTEIEARRAFKQFQPEFIPRLEREMIKEPQGILEIFDAEYDKSAEVENVVRIVPEDVQTKVKIFGIRTFDDILQKNHFKDLVYNGTIEFRFDQQGNLMGISEIPLESYLKRVIYSEIGTELPLEFSKSLAIVCRSEAMARIEHRNLGEPYDYCHTGETLRYFGEDFEDDGIDKAVEMTEGQVIFADNFVRDTPFHLICGGHTEDATSDGEKNEGSFFSGRYDWKKEIKEFADLSDEKTVRKWINSRPDAWCNLKGRQVPQSLEWVKKYFRWEVDYSRRELEEIIRKKTGEDIGILFEIIPIIRGCSGRLLEVELIGSLRNYRIRGELNIREALSYERLPSTCFITERELDDTGTPISFTFVGAGQGHGVGMCKTGAAVMAVENFTSQQILEHYFESCQIHSIYEMDLE